MWSRIRPRCATLLGKSIAVAFSNSRSPREYEVATDTSLVAENLCLRQQLLVLQRRHPRPPMQNPDRRFWTLASRVVPALHPGRCWDGTVGDGKLIGAGIRDLREDWASGSRPGPSRSTREIFIEELCRLGWRNFLALHAREFWARDFFCDQTIFFRTNYVFFITRHAGQKRGGPRALDSLAAVVGWVPMMSFMPPAPPASSPGHAPERSLSRAAAPPPFAIHVQSGLRSRGV